MRILHILEPGDGGVPEHVRLLSAGLVARGHEVVAAARPEADVAPARHVALPFRGEMIAPREDASALRGVLALLRAERFDVVHAHAQKAGVLGRLAAFATRVPAVYTPHSFVYRSQFGRGRRSAKVRYVAIRELERRLGARTAALIGVSAAEARVALEDRITRPERIHTILNGVAITAGAEPDGELVRFRGDGPLAGVVAGLRDQKGHGVLLDALDLLAARGTPLRCAIVGNGYLEDDIRRRAGADTLVVPFAGGVEPYLAALDVFVLPSLWEGLPLAVLEAMAASLPVVATAVGGTPEAVVDGVTGWVVDPGDAEGLAAALTAAASDADERRRRAAAGLKRVQELFGVERMVDETEAVYEAVAR